MHVLSGEKNCHMCNKEEKSANSLWWSGLFGMFAINRELLATMEINLDAHVSAAAGQMAACLLHVHCILVCV